MNGQRKCGLYIQWKYFAAIRNDEYSTFALSWMELEGIMLSEVSQPEKDKYCMVSFIQGNIKKNGERDSRGKERKRVGNIRKGDRP